MFQKKIIFILISLLLYQTPLQSKSSSFNEINSKNCQTIINQNNRLKNKIKKYLYKNLKENTYLKEKINILLDRNYKLIKLNNCIINKYESNMTMYKIIGSFFTSTIFGVCYYYWKNIK